MDRNGILKWYVHPTAVKVIINSPQKKANARRITHACVYVRRRGRAVMIRNPCAIDGIYRRIYNVAAAAATRRRHTPFTVKQI